VGNLLGAGNPKGAKRASYVTIGIMCMLSRLLSYVVPTIVIRGGVVSASIITSPVCIATVYTAVLEGVKHYIGRIFTEDE